MALSSTVNMSVMASLGLFSCQQLRDQRNLERFCARNGMKHLRSFSNDGCCVTFGYDTWQALLGNDKMRKGRINENSAMSCGFSCFFFQLLTSSTLQQFNNHMGWQSWLNVTFIELLDFTKYFKMLP